jgi:UDP-GlcNAc:undecaprenyl-phosphate GlcNAc-1-phosphate transferase
MLMLLVFFALSLGLSLLLTPLARALASQFGLTDKPDERRKLHDQAIPVGGGVAVLLASLATIGVMLLVDAWRGELYEQVSQWLAPPWWDLGIIVSGGNEFHDHLTLWLGLALASIFICGVGILDDRGYLRGRYKLLGQLVAIGILINAGLVVETIGIASIQENPIPLGIWSIPFTAFFLLGAINSLNLLDGMDGLLSTVALIVTLAFAGMSVMGDKWFTACVAVTIAGALLGFLRYNLPPASIYLGDAGSMLIGLVIGSLAIKSSLKGPACFALAAPVAVLVIPILDTTAAIFRRKLTGRSIYTTDRGHLHHCLLRQGFSKEMVLLFVAIFCLWAAGGAYLSITLNKEWLALLAALTVALALISMRWFGYGEMLLIGDRLRGMAASVVRSRGSIGPHHSAIQLQGCGAWTDQWATLTEAAEEMALKAMRLDINAPALHESYHGRWVNPCDEEDTEGGDTSWNVAIPLLWRGQTVGRLEVSGGRDDQPVWQKIATLTKLVDELEQILCKIADDAGFPIPPPLPEPVQSAHQHAFTE